MIKWFALTLIVANLGFCAWTQGVFGPTLPPPDMRQREPGRLQQQVRPESVVVLSPRAASAALEKWAASAASEAASAPAGEPRPISADLTAASAPATGTEAARPGKSGANSSAARVR